MNDDEARYLIDQYNKYVSWKTRHGELGLFGVAAGIAAAALAASIASLVWRVSSFNILLVVLMLILTLGLMVYLWWVHSRVEKSYQDYERILKALEDYRFNHKLEPNKALPDDITFRLVVEEPEKAEKLLKDSGPSPQS